MTVCRSFWSSHPDLSIGVHCTHGFNRTGYMICGFLTRELGWDISAAAAQFTSSRPPGIYKAHYLREMFEKFDGDVADIRPPPIPDWHAEDEDDDDDVGGAARKRRREDGGGAGMLYAAPTKEPATTFLLGVHGQIGRLVGGQEMYDAQRQCLEYCGSRHGHFPGSQPVSLDRQNMEFFRNNEYMVSWKADGTRYLMLILRHASYMMDRDFRVYRIDGLRFVQRKVKGEPVRELEIWG